MIYSVGKNFAELEAVAPASFTALNVWERTHIQEWIRTNPQILGEELLIVAMEFDRFMTSSDRLDLLALDRDGNLVVVELKRDRFAGSADLQALRYAAMVSSMTVKMLVPYYVDYLKRYEQRETNLVEAEAELRTFVSDEGGLEELSSTPRIILCSQGFSQEITTAVLWLNESRLDITCVQITPYQHGGTILIVPQVIIPLAESQQYQVEIKAKEETAQRAAKVRKGRVMPFLLTRGLIKAGDRIVLSRALPAWITFQEDDPRFRATITGKGGRSDAILWDFDGKEYSISGITWKVFTDLHPDQADYGSVRGSDHWAAAGGKSLSEIADEAVS